MAKKQTFADKASKRQAVAKINVKYVKTVKTESGSYKFLEKYVQVDDPNKIATLKW